MKRVGIVGCGAIGSSLASSIEKDFRKFARLVALCDVDSAKAVSLKKKLSSKPAILSLSDLVRSSQLIIEAASVSCVSQILELALPANKDVMIMSSGGLLTSGHSWRRLLAASKSRLMVPSGALCGLDGIKAMATKKIYSIRLTTTKPPKALSGAPWIEKKKIDLSKINKPSVVFEGTPKEAISAFPQNTNVTATALLASENKSTKPANISVRIIADPKAKTNTHELEVDGESGRFNVRVENVPSKENPKTSELAFRSAIASLKNFFEPVRIGT